MELINIYPLKNQNRYRDEKNVMILAQLLDKYDPHNFSEDQFIILDNGLYESSQVSTKLEDFVNMAENSSIPVNEIVIPDTFFDMKDTIKKFEDNLNCIKKYSNKYSFMFVAQSKNIKELEKNIKYINDYKDLNITVGIPKKAPYDRESNVAIEVYKKSTFPIHFLGLEDNKEIFDLKRVKDVIRSCDTSQICTMSVNNITPERILHYNRDEDNTDSKIIDLVNDCIDEDYIDKAKEYLNDFMKELRCI